MSSLCFESKVFRIAAGCHAGAAREFPIEPGDAGRSACKVLIGEIQTEFHDQVANNVFESIGLRLRGQQQRRASLLRNVRFQHHTHFLTSMLTSIQHIHGILGRGGLAPMWNKAPQLFSPIDAAYFGRRTESITWMTPLLQSMSVLMTLALSTITVPSLTLMMIGWPLTVLADVILIT